MGSIATAPQPWSLATRVSFRFVFAYLLLYDISSLAMLVPGGGLIFGDYDALWLLLVRWVGANFLAVDITVLSNGSGDTTFNYVQVLCYAAIALLVTVVWSLLDRRRPQYVALHDVLRTLVRLTLATTMWGYGMSKVIPLQFSSPGADRLLTSYGDSSPMGLLWTFMGASTAYTVFSGVCEVLGGTLLLFRRTTTLGALVTAAVMVNVVALNYCYDVPVKLYSTHLLAQALFLAAPDVARLFDVFVLHRALPARDFAPPPGPRWLRVTRRIAGGALILWIVSSNILDALSSREQYGDATPKHELVGVWDVVELACNGEPCPLICGTPRLWRQVGFSAWGGCSIRMTDDTRERFMVEVDAAKKTLSMRPFDDREHPRELAWSRGDDGQLALDGKFGEDELHVRLRPRPDGQFLLTSRGFHWINEFPFNR